MDIFTALKKEKRSKTRFYTLMILIAIMLPIILWITKVRDIFFIGYAGIVEILIILVIIKKIDFHRLQYSYALNKLHFKSGLFSKESLLLCDQVSIVHTTGIEEDMVIVIVSSIRFRNSKLKPIIDGFLKKYPEVAKEYERLKRINPEKSYYFQTIKKGGLKKYNLLGTIFKYCSKAIYTDDCVQNIKISRGEILD